MSGERRNPDMRQCGDEVAAYVLGALEPVEVESFRRHLDSCVVCRDELVTFQQIVDVLPQSVEPRRVPKALRRSVLRAIEEAEPRLERRGARRRPASSLRFRFRVPRPALALAGVAATAAIVVGAIQVGSTGANQAPPEARVYPARVIGTGASAEVRVTAGHAVLVVHHLSPPPAGHIYEVWLARGAHGLPQPTHPTALFSVTASGEGDADVPGDLHGVRQVMVTAEPSGGSGVPTGRAVIQAQLT